jgi:large subunit ribosomal protein L9
MKLLLKKDVPSLGYVGDIVNVKIGYARNFLLPNRLATEPTQGNIRAIAKDKEEADKRRRAHLEGLIAIASAVNEAEVTIEAAANPDGHLYGSVGAREIAAALKEQGHQIEPGHIELRDPIRRLDSQTVMVRLGQEVTAEVKVWVVASGATMDVEDADDRDREYRDAETSDDQPEGREADNGYEEPQAS